MRVLLRPVPVVVVDFTGRLMSVLADGVLVAMALVVLRPLLRKSE
ncbi:DUF3927 family protein [Escherichia coli]|nr:DUF3927 family protein [Escherichia coli]